jgi:hypothetical protein
MLSVSLNSRVEVTRNRKTLHRVKRVALVFKTQHGEDGTNEKTVIVHRRNVRLMFTKRALSFTFTL